MTREEYLVRARRAARGYGGKQSGKRGFAGRLTVQILVCIIAFGGFMSIRHIGVVEDSVKHYLNYTVDCKESVEGIIDRCRSVFTVNDNA